MRSPDAFRAWRHTLLTLPLLASVGLAGCAWTDGRGLVPRPSTDAVQYASYAPSDRPFLPVAAGVASRTAFETATGAGYHLTVADLVVAPSEQPRLIPLVGAAVVEVRSGTGLVTVGGKTTPASPGTMFAVSEGEGLGVQARGAPMTLHVHVYRAD